VSLEPLTLEHAVALRDYARAASAVRELFDRGVIASKGYEGAPDTPQSKELPRGQQGRFQHLQPKDPAVTPWWPLGYYELFQDSADRWAAEPTGQPVFYVGATIPKGQVDHLREASHLEWLAAVEKHGFTMRDDDTHTRIVRSLYLAEIAARASTLDLQVEKVARWIDTSLDTLIAHPPPARSPAAGDGPGTWP